MLYRNAVKFVRRVLKLYEHAASDHFGADLLAEIQGLLNRFPTAQDVVNDYRRIDLVLAHILAKLPFAVFHFGPVDLIRGEGLADAERDHDTARARGNDGDFWEAAGYRLLHPEESAETDRKYSGVVVKTKGERHLKVV